jgi:glyoxylase-like metal-dependent hydrolase (beta-lactamase superfamily II)
MSNRSRDILAVDEAEREDWEAGLLREAADLGDGWWSIPVAIPEGTLPGTLAYAVIGDDGVHLIDPGWDTAENLGRIERALATAGRSVADIATVIVTHHHPDHLGLAERLRTLTGARIVMSAAERGVLAAAVDPSAQDPDLYVATLVRWGVPEERHAELVASFTRPSLTGDVEPDVLVGDRDALELGGRRLEVIETPGHTGGHICIADRDARLLFTGDHVLPSIYSGVGIGVLDGTEPMGDLLASLDRLAEFDDFTVLPGHEFRFTGLAVRRAQIAAHHLRRTGEVAALATELGERPVWAYASRLTWTAGWRGLNGFWLHSALRQTEMHLGLVRSGRAAGWLIRD